MCSVHEPISNQDYTVWWYGEVSHPTTGDLADTEQYRSRPGQ